ncbi:MAG: hypothetical protein LLF94_00565 [Chlamydiales bacterium]|nr:hypothetical protein [Chlamydiales bacterium]
MDKWNVVLGFFQNAQSAKACILELEKHGFCRVASIIHPPKCAPVVTRYFSLPRFVATLVAAFLGLMIALSMYLFPSIYDSEAHVVEGFGAIFALSMAPLFVCYFKYRLSREAVHKYKKFVFSDEILVIAEVKTYQIKECLTILRQTKVSQPITFLLSDDTLVHTESLVLPDIGQNREQLNQTATSLAYTIKNVLSSRSSHTPLLNELRNIENTLNMLHLEVSKVEHTEQPFSSSISWFLDNITVIQGSIEEIKRNLSRGFYRQLPKVLVDGKHLPRVYVVASSLVRACAGKVNKDNITDFLNTYQSVSPLSIGELWAFPLMLKLSLLEWVELLSQKIVERMGVFELANFWGNRLLHASARSPTRVNELIDILSREIPNPSPQFAQELIDHLFDDETTLLPVKNWLQSRFQKPLVEVFHQEQIEEASEQVMFSNTMISLVAQAQISWRDIFEGVSLSDAALKEDPAGIYGIMDFESCNLYRETIEELCKRSHVSEVEIAQKCVELARFGSTDYDRHVGYYLIDEGRHALEASIAYRPSLKKWAQNVLKAHGTLFYLGSICVVTALLEAFVILYAKSITTLDSILAILGCFALIPISEIVIQTVNFLLARVLPISVLPKIDYQKGIPEKQKTLVIVPIMLTSLEDIQEEVNRLEIRYLANVDDNLLFGLFSDFKDAPQQFHEKDQELIDFTIKEMQKLEAKYGNGKFFLFHRQRVWSNSENAWIGWERKRGKLEILNRFLSGDELSENILYYGQHERLKNISYVITLDSDTQLSKNQGKSLIGILSHPLNSPVLHKDGKKLDRGYTIIQPMVCTDFPHAKNSRFLEIFSDPSVIDPYTHAVSNIFQDLCGEGSYHGKGIYDLKAFHSILSGRYPIEHVLSHDLIEGAYVRVGFTASVCLFDLFPDNYLSLIKRQRRWIRGDWQVIDWLLPKAPSNGGPKVKNPLSAMNRWKIFDNLRRSLLPISVMLLLITSWLVPQMSAIWTLVGAASIFLPPLLQVIGLLFNKMSYTSFSLWREMGLSIVRALLNMALLPQEAYFSLDSIVRVCYRRLISHRQLLEWNTAQSMNNLHMQAQAAFLFRISLASLFALFCLFLVAVCNPQGLLIASPFCALWIIGPVILHYISKPTADHVMHRLSQKDRDFLRRVARKTWRYFDDFVNQDTNWLPPDNYQAALNVELALRTSPTNIGLWLIGVLNAYDLKYIPCDKVIDLISATLKSLALLERYEGHFLNWYDIKTLKPLYPRYLSTVDSGNLLASFWTVQQGMYDVCTSPLVQYPALTGIEDTLRVVLSEVEGTRQDHSSLHKLEEILFNASPDLYSFVTSVTAAYEIVLTIGATSYWMKSLEKQLAEFDEVNKRYFKWVPLLKALTENEYHLIHVHAQVWIDAALNLPLSLKMLADGALHKALNPLLEAALRPDLPPELRAWAGELKEAVESAQWLAGEKLAEFDSAIRDIEVISSGMNLGYLYNSDRKLFAIGYNVDDMRIDASHYDLLASEARLASLVAIAKDDVPLDHWWSLGRPYGLSNGKKVLLSWGGTMFEYLMPVLFSKYYPESLLGSACRSAVDCQIAYGELRGIPWGISEAAYSAIDAHKIYQYKAFGVVGLGLKRGLENDLVVSPYSSVLALAIDPKAAIENLHILASRKNSMWGDYGYFESIDFSHQATPAGDRGVVIEAYMVHHQGMSFAAINNILNDDIITKRFGKDPRISGVEFLLFERPPLAPSITANGYRKESGRKKLAPVSTVPIMGVSETPNTAIPKLSLLSNHTYSIVVTNAGGGYSRYNDVDITRFRADTTCDEYGSFFFIKDLHSHEKWSATFQPTLQEGTEYSSSFKANKVEFKRKDYNIETVTQIVVSPEDNAEIRSLSLLNKSGVRREIEVTSYQELVLAPHAADRAHPAFNKLFIETESIPELHGLLAFRRLRAPDDKQIWVGHVAALETENNSTHVQFETNRANFIGRGRSIHNPIAIDSDLTNTAGTVLDPILSLRHRLVLEPGKVTKISFVTVCANTREQAITLMEKYQKFEASSASIELAWTYSQLELRHLNITLEDIQLFQKLASRIIFPHKQLRASPDRLEVNTLGQSELWKYGISGDVPLVVVSVDDAYDIILVKQMVLAHAFWRSRGLVVDLLILNEEDIGYENPLHDQLQRLIQNHGVKVEPNGKGGVYLHNIHTLPEAELTLVLSVASVFLIAARGSLRQQLVSPLPATHYPSPLVIRGRVEEPVSRELPFLELPYFNGLGGYSPDGKVYSIYLGPETVTPAPWINVIANAKFGTLVTEAGNGTSWFDNSQSNRLTPWSNDPVSNPIADAIYIRDEISGTFWSPTPAPIRELDAYRISHGKGFSRFEHNSHGIEQELLIFVPMDESGGKPVRIQKLTLHNSSNLTRYLTITSHQDIVMGGNKEQTQMHIVTDWNSDQQALFATNAYNSTFTKAVAFATSIPACSSHTGDRTEFIGRNGTMANPAALKRRGLSNHTGAGFDPCASLQVSLVLKPGATEDVFFVLGYAVSGIQEAKDLVKECQSREKIEALLASTHAWWNGFVESVQVEVPDLQTNFALNNWLPYQNLSCRIWGRSGFYQSSGAYGFRDQLQDVMGLVYSRPELARQQILRAAARQFIEGDVQHWWDPVTGSGVRTRFSDDLLWLPFITAQYVRTTGDRAILDEQIPFLSAPVLTEDEHEIFSTPEVSQEKASLLEHCRRSIEKGLTAGKHGLPLIGGGDWNDGMNRVGVLGIGESVWLAWFIIHVLHDYIELISPIATKEVIDRYVVDAERLASAIEATAWDGAWYRRAYYDNGAPLGSSKSQEAVIDSLAQSWSVISNAGEPARSKIALQSAYERLVKVQEKVVLLLTPPFDKTTEDPGYIKGYPPGVRENGGQYTHGSLWLAMAFARMGDGDRAVELIQMMHPGLHTQSVSQTDVYKIEPYVLAGDVYDLAGQVGRGGWSWYTGSSAWMYRIWLEEILGFTLRGNTFSINCCIPKAWDGYKIRYKYKSAVYEIEVENPEHVSRGKSVVTLDGTQLDGQDIPLVDDGQTHVVHIVLQ